MAGCSAHLVSPEMFHGFKCKWVWSQPVLICICSQWTWFFFPKFTLCAFTTQMVLPEQFLSFPTLSLLIWFCKSFPQAPFFFNILFNFALITQMPLRGAPASSSTGCVLCPVHLACPLVPFWEPLQLFSCVELRPDFLSWFYKKNVGDSWLQTTVEDQESWICLTSYLRPWGTPAFGKANFIKV